MERISAGQGRKQARTSSSKIDPLLPNIYPILHALPSLVIGQIADRVYLGMRVSCLTFHFASGTEAASPILLRASVHVIADRAHGRLYKIIIIYINLKFKLFYLLIFNYNIPLS